MRDLVGCVIEAAEESFDPYSTTGGRARRLALAVFALALVVAAVLLLLPADELPDTNIWDKLEHASVFTLLMLIGGLARPQRRWRAGVAVSLVTFGAVCEVLQMFVPGRESSVEDAIANSVGVAVALVVLSGLNALLGPGRRRYLRAARSGPASPEMSR